MKTSSTSEYETENSVEKKDESDHLNDSIDFLGSNKCKNGHTAEQAQSEQERSRGEDYFPIATKFLPGTSIGYTIRGAST